MLNHTHLSRIDLNLLVLFTAVFEERHVGRAAERLNLTPSAVSHGLSRLRRLLNDPVFLRTPRGVVPTERADALAEPIADILTKVQVVVSASAPFDPATSQRRFVIGAPDAIATVVLLPLMADLKRTAPGIDIGVRQELPETQGAAGNPWELGLACLDTRTSDLAILPLSQMPARFASARLFDERFVIASRANHPFARKPNLDTFCAARHLVVSLTGDAHGFVDDALARHKRTRRVVLTVPSFSMALALLAELDLVAALPARLVAERGAAFGLVATDAPFATPLRSDPITVIATHAAMRDAGVSWLFRRLVDLSARSTPNPSPPLRKRRKPSRKERP
jgi:DNA-binding transcriptional LysR family regulator